jgi:hypothetical protein
MKLLIIGLFLFSSSLFASFDKDVALILATNEKEKKGCRGLKITKEQRSFIKTLIKKTRSEIRPHYKAIKAAKKELGKALYNIETTKEEAVAAKKAFKAAKSPALMIKRQAKLEVQYDILSGKQRIKLLKCRRKARKKL